MTRKCKCGKDIPYTVIIDGKRHNLYNRTKCLDCLPFKTSRYCLKTPGQKRSANTMKMFRYMTKYKEAFGTEPICMMRTLRRQAVIKLIGGSCQFCGYNKLIKNLAFHHLRDKNDQLTEREFQKSPAKVIPEALKCVIACHNCHGEIHENIVTPLKIEAEHANLVRALSVCIDKTWEDILTLADIHMPRLRDLKMGRG